MSREKTPAVGEEAPDFALIDSTGEETKLSWLVAVRPIILLFYRGDW